MPSLVLLAAGMGSRYGGLKQMEPLGPSGETLMDYSVFDAIRAGFNRVIFVIRKDFADAFRETVGRRYESRVQVDYAFQDLNDLPAPFQLPSGRTKPWGTGHATRAARHFLDRPFSVINADDFYGRDSFEKMSAFLRNATDSRPLSLAMIGFRLRNTLSDFGSVSRGVCQVDQLSRLTSIQEMTRIFRTETGARNLEDATHPVALTGEEIVSMNMWGFPSSFMEDLEASFHRFLQKNHGSITAEHYIPTPVDELIRSCGASVAALPTDSPWFGVTYREEADFVRERLRKLTDYPDRLWD